jgi:hypothetical protein
VKALAFKQNNLEWTVMGYFCTLLLPQLMAVAFVFGASCIVGPNIFPTKGIILFLFLMAAHSFNLSFFIYLQPVGPTGIYIQFFYSVT